MQALPLFLALHLRQPRTAGPWRNKVRYPRSAAANSIVLLLPSTSHGERAFKRKEAARTLVV